MPPGLRKSGMPDSVLTPAPVKTTARSLDDSIFLSSSICRFESMFESLCNFWNPKQGASTEGRPYRSAVENSDSLTSLASSAPHPAVLRVARPWRLLILLSHLRDLVTLDRLALCFYVDLVNPRRIQSKDLRFDFGSEFLVAEFLRDLIADLESTQAFDLRLRAASPD